MSDDVSLLVDGDKTFVPHFSPRSHQCGLSGLDIVALPPGRVDVLMTEVKPFLNVAPVSRPSLLSIYRVDGENALDRCVVQHGGAMDICAGGHEHRAVCVNHEWELLIEFDPDKLDALAAEAWDGDARLSVPVSGHRDPTAINLGALLIRHLRFEQMDRIFVEGLALALAARSISLATGRSEERPPNGGTDPRIARAIDYIEAHLGDDLSVAVIASAVGMSPSWFQSAFKSVTGQPVFAYVRERRLDRVRILLADRSLSLSQIAYECGFSSHSHMTNLFRAHHGMSPREMR
ncbi:AraC family transcriptional regulator [Cognatiyoonia sp. IB215182]|uniref:AraC family transcriptional regulator n=1 Tax=Cognatiyoonia sp. IB215182 TaxID=3097353 RepID=UPI002A14B7FD|nr:AraC family transcriptional regulator [Cognatiyoonia sp. IB215182]MDX8350874.1 AraC family transcriptional regulator [Cognatiyoonia sp. IB215182]